LIFKLHNSYKPKKRPEFDPIENWNILIKQNDATFFISIRDELKKVIEEYLQSNKKIADRLQLSNNLCLINMLIVVCIFLIWVTNYFI
jgi:hypothetical protein